MRRRYRRRSTVSLVLWGLAFSGGIIVMAWQFGWLPTQFDLHDLVGHDHNVGKDSDNKAANASAPKSNVPSATLFADDPSTLVDEDELYAKFVQQTRKRSISQTAGQTNHPLSAGPWNNSVQPSVRSNLPPQNKGTRSVANAPVRNSLYLRPQNDSRSRPGVVPADIVQAGSTVTGTRPGQASEFPPSVPFVPQSIQKRLQEADLLIQDGLHLSAHRELSKLYWNHPDLRSAFQARIDQTALPIYFSPQPHFMKPYQVQPGDQLRLVAKQYGISWEYIEKLNRIDSRRIRPAQELKVIKGPFSAIIELSRFEMTVHAHGYYVRKYAVGIGRDGATPIGRFTVINKVVNPQYTGPDNVVIHADDPRNPLGERWIDLGNGYGIHGTIDPKSIGKAESRGCIRLKNSEVEEVYNLLVTGSVVEIRR